MRTGPHPAMFAVTVLFAEVVAQTTGGESSESETAAANQWAFSVLASVYLLPNDQL